MSPRKDKATPVLVGEPGPELDVPDVAERLVVFSVAGAPPAVDEPAPEPETEAPETAAANESGDQGNAEPGTDNDTEETA